MAVLVTGNRSNGSIAGRHLTDTVTAAPGGEAVSDERFELDRVRGARFEFARSSPRTQDLTASQGY